MEPPLKPQRPRKETLPCKKAPGGSTTSKHESAGKTEKEGGLDAGQTARRAGARRGASHPEAAREETAHKSGRSPTSAQERGRETAQKGEGERRTTSTGEPEPGRPRAGEPA